MRKTLEELWRKTRRPTVQYAGQTVHRAVFKEVRKPGRFIVRFLKAVEKPVQGLSIDIDPGDLVIEDTTSPKMILRLDTCPDVVEAHYRPSSRGSKITFYNSWINEDDGIDSGLRHFGMLVEETGNKMTLRCSDGRGEPTFDDLIVEIEFPVD
ncbi:MAG: hypothetical protein AB1664_11660 [Thermodesulfobacteriota bacterium]